MKQYYVDFVEKEVNRRLIASNDYSDTEFMQLIETCIRELEKRVSITKEDAETLSGIVFNSRRRLGLLQPLLDDPEVNEIMINGTESIYIEKKGKLLHYNERYSDATQLFNVVQSMVAWVDRSVNESSPIVDTRLADGSRVNIVLKPVALNGPIVTIRKFPDKLFSMDELIMRESITEEESEFLMKCVRARVNIFVSGGTSSGKTTFLNVLCGFVPENERVVTIEDSAELRLTPPNLVRLETKNDNSEGKGGIPMRALIKTALRMRPDRIIVGEVRDEAAVDMLQAMCTGHDGSLSTCHANSAEDVLTRLETMALWEGNINSTAVRKQIASGLDLIVHMQRDASMRRYVKEIAEVRGIENGEIVLNRLYFNGKFINSATEGGKLYEKLYA